MKPSNGVIRVCGQFDRSEASRRSCTEVEVRRSQFSRCCGSSASDLTVRMPYSVSTSTLLFCVSAAVQRPTARFTGPMNSTMITAMQAAPAIVIQASVGWMKNRIGITTSRVTRSMNVVIILPVRNSRIRLTWASR